MLYLIEIAAESKQENTEYAFPLFNVSSDTHYLMCLVPHTMAL